MLTAMELGFLLLTDHSEAVNGKLYAIGGGWNMIRLGELPSTWAFQIALGVDVAWEETNHKHNLHVVIHDPDGGEMGEGFTAEFETGRPSGMPAGQDQRLVMTVGARTTFSMPGPHAAVVSVDGEVLGRSRFYVTTEQPPAA